MGRRKQAPQGGGAGWIVTWSDMMSLMFCFFVMLYITASGGGGGSGGSAGTAEFLQTVSSSVKGNFTISQYENLSGISVSKLFGNGVSYMPKLPLADSEEIGTVKDTISNTENMADAFKTYLAENNVGADEVDVVVKNEAQVELIFKDDMLFDKGRADIKPSAIKTLDLVAAQLTKFPSMVVQIEGHTDSDPISTSQYKDNWALSFDRAAEIGRYLINEKNIDPSRVVPLGHGEYMPRAENTTDENKSKNRRVEITITNTTLSSSVGE